MGTLHVRGFVRSGASRFTINKSIVENIIRNLLFHPDDVGDVTYPRALSIHKSEVDSADAQPHSYIAEVQTVKRFRLAAKFVGFDDSFRSSSRQLGVIGEETGMAEYGNESDVTISSFFCDKISEKNNDQVLFDLLYFYFKFILIDV